MAKVIRIKPLGQLGNRMFQYLLARILQTHAPEALIAGLDLPEFGLSGAAVPPGKYAEIAIRSHLFPFDATVQSLQRSDDVLVRLEWVCMRMEYFRRHLGSARALFPIDPKLKTGFDARSLVISIRAADVLRGRHPNYTVLPLAWYRHLIAVSALEPVFLGQIGDDPYCDALRAQFPAARFVTNADPLDDFNMLRTSVNVVLSVSSFAWMAAWLSTSAQRIVLPMIGLYNPFDRPDIDLLPVGDERYRFYRFPSERWTGSPEQVAAKIGRTAEFGASAPRRPDIQA
jgi:hypothetical protein